MEVGQPSEGTPVLRAVAAAKQARNRPRRRPQTPKPRSNSHTSWMNVDLFRRRQHAAVQMPAIKKYVKNIFESGKVIREATISQMETVRAKSGREFTREVEFCSLDAIIAVGYRVDNCSWNHGFR